MKLAEQRDDIDADQVGITNHALKRFNQRCDEKMIGKNPKDTLLKLFKKSTEVKFSPKYQVKRLLKHKLKQVQYFYSSGLVFVLDPDSNTILTVENQEHRKLGRDIFFQED